jgi:hypothetical protein
LQDVIAFAALQTHFPPKGLRLDRFYSEAKKNTILRLIVKGAFNRATEKCRLVSP